MFPNPYTNTLWMRESHPFLLEIAKELEKLGCVCAEVPNFPTLSWLLRERKNIDIIHVHWPEQYYEYKWLDMFEKLIPKPFKKLNHLGLGLYFGAIWLILFLRLLKILDIPLVWTLHDLQPHTQYRFNTYPIQQILRKHLMENTNVLLVNCHGVENLVRSNFHKAPEIVVSPLGNYRVFYPETVDRNKARNFFGISNHEIMVLFFGTQRPQRNALELTRVFKKIKNKNICLFVAGSTDQKLKNEIEDMAWGDWRIRHYTQQASNDKIEFLLKASDILVMPGHDYFTSAVIVLALSYGVPVVAPNYGCAPDMIKNSGVLYTNNGSEDDLLQALETAINKKDELFHIAQAQIENWSWGKTAKQILFAYEKAMGNDKGV